MSKQIEALKLALEALEHEADTGNDDAYKLERDAIKETLAQPWEKFCDSNCVWTDHHPDCKLAQRIWVGLTDIDYAGLPLEQVGLVRWAEAKLKEKNHG